MVRGCLNRSRREGGEGGETKCIFWFKFKQVKVKKTKHVSVSRECHNCYSECCI